MQDALHAMTPEILHNEMAARFETTVDGHLCVLDYQRHGDVLWITHTGVPAQVGGRGVAAALVRGALDWVAAQGLRVQPVCSYVEAYMRRHPQTQALLVR